MPISGISWTKPAAAFSAQAADGGKSGTALEKILRRPGPLRAVHDHLRGSRVHFDGERPDQRRNASFGPGYGVGIQRFRARLRTGADPFRLAGRPVRSPAGAGRRGDAVECDDGTDGSRLEPRVAGDDPVIVRRQRGRRVSGRCPGDLQLAAFGRTRTRQWNSLLRLEIRRSGVLSLARVDADAMAVAHVVLDPGRNWIAVGAVLAAVVPRFSAGWPWREEIRECGAAGVGYRTVGHSPVRAHRPCDAAVLR